MGSSATQPQEIASRSQFAQALTAQRVRAGLTVRELARRLDVPAATLGDYFSGRHLPSPSQLALFRAVLAECLVTESSEVEQWVDALARLRLSSDGRAARTRAPYLGLEPFRRGDADLFFGRDESITAVLDRLRELRDDPLPAHGMLAIVGPSGSGKSSLVRAGVAPRVDAGAIDTSTCRWQSTIVTPGPELSDALSQHAATSQDAGRVLIVDQFEELFTSASDVDRSSVIGALAELDPTRTLTVWLIRADFYDLATRDPRLLAVLRNAQVLLGPMSKSEVRRAITEPARQVGATVDDDLVDLILSDLAPRGAADLGYDPGALPLLSHALQETWQQASRNQLTAAAYRAAGGLRGAVEQTAERLYESLSPEEQDLARRILLRLVNLDEGSRLTRRRVSRQELAGLGDDESKQDSIDDVVERFVSARLLTADAGSVQVSHETLLSAWSRLREWLASDRASLSIHRRVTDAANAWHAAGNDESLLLRGTRLAATTDWAVDHGPGLNRIERDFLNTSLAQEEAQRNVERKRTRRMKQSLVALVVAALVAIGSSVYAFEAKADADQARDQALSRDVAIEAGQVRRADPNLAMQLALAAYRIAPTVEARSQLIDSSAGEMPTRLLGSPGQTVVTISPDGRLLAVSDAGARAVRLYALGAGVPDLVATIPASKPDAQVFGIAVSPDSRTLATGDTAGNVRLWDIADSHRPVALATLRGMTGTVESVSFSRDGTRLAATGKGIRQWDMRDRSHPVALPTLDVAGTPTFFGAAYSPDGKLLAAAGAGGLLAVWPAGAAAVTPTPATATSGSADLTAVAFGSDDAMVATAGRDGVVRLWSLGQTGKPKQVKQLTGFTSWVDSLAFSPDGRMLAAGSSDNTLRIWDTKTWTPVATFAHPGPVTGVAFTPDDHTLVSGDEDGAARLWSLPPPSIGGLAGNAFALGYTPDSHTLAAVTSGTGGVASLWDVTNPRRPATIDPDVAMPTGFGPVAGTGALSPNGRILAFANRKADIALVDVHDPNAPKQLSVLTGAAPLVESIAFNPKNTLVAAGDDQARIHLWDITNPTHPVPYPPLTGPGSIVLCLAFSPNGQVLAAASADTKVYLWDLRDPNKPKRLAVLSGFSNYAYSLVFTPDSKTLIAGSADHTIRIWDVSNPAKPKPLGHPLSGPQGYVYFLALSPDGKTLVAGNTDDSVWLWNVSDVARPTLLATLHASTQPVFAVAYGPDGKTIAATGADRTIHLWDPDASTVAHDVCTVAGDPITQAEWKQYVPGASYAPPCGSGG